MTTRATIPDMTHRIAVTYDEVRHYVPVCVATVRRAVASGALKKVSWSKGLIAVAELRRWIEGGCQQ